MVVREFLKLEASVILLVRSERSKQNLNTEFADFQNQISFVIADMLNESAVLTGLDRFTKIDALVHIAGGFDMGDTGNFSLEAWNRQLEINLTSAFIMIKNVLPKMRKSGYGRIVAVGSRAAVEPMASAAAYSASKAGLIGLLKSVAEETKGSGITANIVLPGTIDTQTNRRQMPDADFGQWIKPESLAGTIARLAHEKSGDLRGSTIQVFGNQ